MKKASEYRQHAEQCRHLARQVPSVEHRRLLNEMAARWDGIADERERNAAVAEANRGRAASDTRRKNGNRA